MVRSVARSIHDRASASVSTGISSPKLLASSPTKRHVSMWVTFAMESRPSSRARLISAQLRPSGEKAPMPTTTASWPGRGTGLASFASPAGARSRPLPAERTVRSPVPGRGLPYASLPLRAPEGRTPRRATGRSRVHVSFIAGILRRHAGPCRCSRKKRRRRETRRPRRPRRDPPSWATRSHRGRARTCAGQGHRPSRCG